jgi:hypothetical protein
MTQYDTGIRRLAAVPSIAVLKSVSNFVLVGVLEYGNMIFVKSYFLRAKNTVSKNLAHAGVD